jgi:hypothetical protein
VKEDHIIAKKTEKKSKATSKSKQTSIPGTERVYHADVTAAAEDYVEVRDERMALTEREEPLHSKLLEKMKQHGITHYIDADAEIEVKVVATEEKAKVYKYDPEKVAKKAARKAEREASTSNGAGAEESAP